jgi:hypothetical protein
MVVYAAIDLEGIMRTLLNKIYYELRKEEIERASTRLKRIKIETILQCLTKLCWKNKLQYEVILKTSDLLIIKMIGNRETVLLMYHKADIVLRSEIDSFMNQLDENRAQRGGYITTGKFQNTGRVHRKRLSFKKDCVLEDSTAFIKRHIGIKGKAASRLRINTLNFFKYLPQ